MKLSPLAPKTQLQAIEAQGGNFVIDVVPSFNRLRWQKPDYHVPRRYSWNQTNSGCKLLISTACSCKSHETGHVVVVLAVRAFVHKVSLPPSCHCPSQTAATDLGLACSELAGCETWQQTKADELQITWQNNNSYLVSGHEIFLLPFFFIRCG